MKRSAALLVYQRQPDGFRVFLVHPGGPFWANRDLGAWSIPKGEFSESEEGLCAARREFFEEAGQVVEGDMIELTPRVQPSHKIIHSWAVEAEVDEGAILFSSQFAQEDRDALGIHGRLALSRVAGGHLPNLAWHRSNLMVDVNSDSGGSTSSEGGEP